MENSILYDSIEASLLRNWQKQAEKEDKNGLIQKACELETELHELGNDKLKQLVSEFHLANMDQKDYVNHIMRIKIFNLGIKIGMQLEKNLSQIDIE